MLEKSLQESVKNEKEREELRKTKMDEMARRAIEESERRLAKLRADLAADAALKVELEKKRRLEIERMLEEERRLLASMSLADRDDYLARKREREETELRRFEEEKRAAEEALRRALEEAKQAAAEEAQRRLAHEQDMNKLRDETTQFKFFHSLTRAFVFSYYDILRFMDDGEAGERGGGGDTSAGGVGGDDDDDDDEYDEFDDDDENEWWHDMTKKQYICSLFCFVTQIKSK